MCCACNTAPTHCDCEHNSVLCRSGILSRCASIKNTSLHSALATTSCTVSLTFVITNSELMSLHSGSGSGTDILLSGSSSSKACGPPSDHLHSSAPFVLTALTTLTLPHTTGNVPLDVVDLCNYARQTGERNANGQKIDHSR